MTTFYEWEESFFSSRTRERYGHYGQAFCNEFIKTSWSELFYADTAKARSMVVQWLIDNHYWPNVPDTDNQLDKIPKAS